jgi:hypothetical protein
MKLQNKTTGMWSGWSFVENNLVDEFGNRYTLAAIRACHFVKQTSEVNKLLIHPGCKGCPKAH